MHYRIAALLYLLKNQFFLNRIVTRIAGIISLVVVAAHGSWLIEGDENLVIVIITG
jgi:hypothetical protein